LALNAVLRRERAETQQRENNSAGKKTNNWMGEKYDSNFITKQIEMSKMEIECETIGQATFKNAASVRNKLKGANTPNTKKKYDFDLVRNLSGEEVENLGEKHGLGKQEVRNIRSEFQILVKGSVAALLANMN
jgi:hypothetical protein